MQGELKLVEFTIGDKTSCFSYKDNKWQFWGNLEIDKSAELFFNELVERIDILKYKKERKGNDKYILLNFVIGDKTSCFGYKDNKWQFWSDGQIDKSAKLFFDKLAERIDIWEKNLKHAHIKFKTVEEL